jgi:hypothetical protein
MQQNQMNQLNMTEKSRSLAEQEGLRNYLRTNPNLDSPEGMQGLNQYGAAGQTLLTARVKQKHDAASAQKSTAEAGKVEYETARAKLTDSLKDAAGLTTPGEAIAHITGAARDGKIPMDKAEQLLASIPQDIGEFGKWRNKMMFNLLSAQNQLEQTIHTVDNGQQVTQYALPKYMSGAAPTVVVQQQKQATPGELLTDTRGRESNRIADRRATAAEKEAEAKANPSEKPLTPLQQQKFRKDYAVDADSVKASDTVASELEKVSDELLGNPEKKIPAHPGLGGITGWMAMVKNAPNGDAAQAEQKLETFKGKINSLGRTLATQDGKLGNMAVQEWKIVADAVQNIDPKAGNLDEQMRDVVRQAKAFAARHKERFDLTYENADALLGKKGAPAAAPVTPTPSASNVVTTPDGMTHTFPNAAAAAQFRKAAGL